MQGPPHVVTRPRPAYWLNADDLPRSLAEVIADLEARIGGNLADQHKPVAQRAFSARKKVKRLRGVWRLVAAADPDLAEVQNRRLRQVGRMLGPLRDTDIAGRLLAELVEGDPALIEMASFVTRPRPDTDPNDGESILESALGLMAHEASPPDWDQARLERAVTVGMKRSRDTIVKRLRAVRKARGTARHERLHALRRAVKYHWMAHRLTAPLPDAPTAAIATAKQIADGLGRYQDHVVLKHRLKAHKWLRSALGPVIGDRMTTLRREALATCENLVTTAP